jgi:hypothetical protein
VALKRPDDVQPVIWAQRLGVVRDFARYQTTQGQPCLAPTLAADVNPRTLPVNIRQAHLHDVAGSQSQASE